MTAALDNAVDIAWGALDSVLDRIGGLFGAEGEDATDA